MGDLNIPTTLWEFNGLLLKMAIYSEFSHKKNVLFHSYVSLSEGICEI